MKNLFVFLAMISCCLTWMSCEDKIDPLTFIGNGELRYPGKVNNVQYLAGENRLRIQVNFGPDPNVDKMIVFWNMKKDSSIVHVDRASLIDNKMEVLIDNLPESVYNFEIYTYDKFNNRSVPVYLTGRTYGTRYTSVLNNRVLKNYEASNEDGDLKFFWGDSIIYSSGLNVIFMDNEDKERSVFVSNKESTTELKNVNSRKEITLSTLFSPEPNAIDTFRSEVKMALDLKKLFVEIAKPYASGYVDGFDSPNNNGWNNLWNNNWGKTFNQNTSGTPWATEAGWGTFETRDLSADKSVKETWFTVDLKQSVRVARYRTGFYWPYMYGAPKETELWAYTGSGTPTAAGGWDNWVKIGTINNAQFLLTAADMAREYPLGDNIYTDFMTVPSSRYYRVKVTENWESRQNQSRGTTVIAEVTFWKYVN